MTVFQWLLIGSLFLLSGNLYAVSYVLIFKPLPADATLGIYILAWPLLVVLDVVLSIAQAFGKSTKVLYGKVKTPTT